MRRALIVAATLLAGAAATFLAGVPAARADDFAPGAEHDLVAKACTACHVGAQVTSQHKSAEQWSETVSQMISNGAQIPDADFDKVVAYLAQNYGPAAPSP